jgi:DNA-binding beta-propeller fold protein YncE
MRKRKLTIGVGLLAGVIGLACASEALDEMASGTVGQAGMAPVFEVDPFWPNPLPNHWVLGSVVGVGVDSRDHVYIIHRQAPLNERTEIGAFTDPPSGECCLPAPYVLVFDPEGNLVDSWGGDGEGYTWPASNHGISIDPMDNVWIGGNGGGDSHLLKFSRDGTFLAEYGVPGQPEVNSTSTEFFGRPAKISFDAAANEVYVADGYVHRRVAVLDMDTGEIKRFWGAYGNVPDDTNPGPYDPDAPLIDQFRTPVHCAEPTNDGLVYVCDRPNNRIQVFQKDGTYVDEIQLAPRTLGDGSTWDIAFSRDPEQTYMYVADGKNMKVYVMDRLELEVLTTFGDGGRQPGLFFAVHSIATDSEGNIYTTETYEGKRVQKFLFRGIGPIRAENQGAPWPSDRRPG